jgi:hypothetical protein
MSGQPVGSAPEGANQLDPTGKYKIKARGASSRVSAPPAREHLALVLDPSGCGLTGS